MMRDLTNPKLIKLKGSLFLVIGILSSVLLLIQAPTATLALLLFIAIWSFCRCYYFASYVIQHYVDPGFRFFGLGAFAKYLTERKKAG